MHAYAGYQLLSWHTMMHVLAPHVLPKARRLVIEASNAFVECRSLRKAQGLNRSDNLDLDNNELKYIGHRLPAQRPFPSASVDDGDMYVACKLKVGQEPVALVSGSDPLTDDQEKSMSACSRCEPASGPAERSTRLAEVVSVLSVSVQRVDAHTIVSDLCCDVFSVACFEGKRCRNISEPHVTKNLRPISGLCQAKHKLAPSLLWLQCLLTQQMSK